MADTEQFENVISTDVLIIGGGAGGIVGALKAREQGAETVVVDKSFAGFAGMVSRGGNGLLSLKKDSDLDEYVEFHVRNIGNYINNQKLLRKMAEVNYESIHALSGWGVQVTLDAEGELGFWKLPGAPWYNTGVELNMMLPLKKQAQKEGVRFVNYVKITTLLKDTSGRVCGAVGYNLLDGAFTLFKAKAVLLATAGCNFRVARMFVGHGDGIKLAWDAGAQMRGAEFGNSHEIVAAATGESLYGTHAFLYNQDRENLFDKYTKGFAPDVTPDMILGFEREIRDGKGPIYVDLAEKRADEEWNVLGGGGAEFKGLTRFFPDKLAWMGKLAEKEHEFFDLGERPEMTLTLHANLGPVRVDEDFRTTVEGLFTVGILCWNGSAIGGCIGHPGLQRGNGIMHAVTSAWVGGAAVGTYAMSVPETNPDLDFAVSHKKALQSRMAGGGTEDPEDLIKRMHEIVCRTKYSLRRSEARLKEAIQKIDTLWDELPGLAADDPHMLAKSLETEAMLLSAKIAYASALERKESRGYHFREDYPETDNENWLKWVLADNAGGEVRISTEAIPIDTYPVKPYE